MKQQIRTEIQKKAAAVSNIMKKINLNKDLLNAQRRSSASVKIGFSTTQKQDRPDSRNTHLEAIHIKEL